MGCMPASLADGGGVETILPQFDPSPVAKPLWSPLQGDGDLCLSGEGAQLTVTTFEIHLPNLGW